MIMQAPAGTILEVPKPERSDSYQIHLKSGAGQIYVVLVNKEKDSEEPLVMQVSMLTCTGLKGCSDIIKVICTCKNNLTHLIPN